MVRYRRLITTNPVFLTLVTANRRPWLDRPEIAELYKQALQAAMRVYAWRCVAWVILPDHLHMLLDPKMKDHANGTYSKFVRGFKYNMTQLVDPHLASEGLWQDRFYEHTPKDEISLQRHFDYIHFNPVKHRYVRHPSEWGPSSFHYYVRNGWYPDEQTFKVDVLDKIPGARYDE